MKSIFDTIADMDFIRRRAVAIEGEAGFRPCYILVGKPAAECWCYQAGPNGETIPYPAEKKDDQPMAVGL